MGKASNRGEQGGVNPPAVSAPPRAKRRKSAPKSKPTVQPKRKPGRPAYEPTPEQRYAVGMGVACGVTQDQLAAFLGISKHTLEKHFAKELQAGLTTNLVKVGGRLLAFALGKVEDVDTKTQLSAMQFYLDRIGKWNQTVKQEVTGKDGGPIQQDVKVDDKRTPADARAIMRELFGSVGPQDDAATPGSHTDGDGTPAEGPASP